VVTGIRRPIDPSAGVSHSYGTSDFLYLVADPTFAPVFVSNGIDTSLAYKATSDPDTLNEAMVDADRIKWIESADKEIKL
jgi:hypothetical protein